jgi:hypothetical protein
MYLGSFSINLAIGGDKMTEPTYYQAYAKGQFITVVSTGGSVKHEEYDASVNWVEDHFTEEANTWPTGVEQ